MKVQSHFSDQNLRRQQERKACICPLSTQWDEGLVLWAWHRRGGGVSCPRLASPRAVLLWVLHHPAGLSVLLWVLRHPHVCPFIGGTLTRCHTGSHRGAAGLCSGPCRAQPRLVQWVIEYHIRQDGDFQLLFRPAVLFGEFEFLWRSQIF